MQRWNLRPGGPCEIYFGFKGELIQVLVWLVIIGNIFSVIESESEEKKSLMDNIRNLDMMNAAHR